ncbi:hypothetical protein ADK70_26990 [Streptomyces rimosus subsp. pseudoverticillatus]|uniref:hypothetical protein n=1 Tax=Streptomyces rimosus TaxID=1927 RepID=UPI0006B2643E|nr:hypothetical protein [Streptomyces rimosus]KOT80905.1 hypothetical protein ADK70_26990 [Streptomyces rimosus subsp. pseudoverticillatus]
MVYDRPLTDEEWLALSDTLRDWLSDPNISGLHRGWRRKNGRATDQPAVIVSVVRKKTPSELGPGDVSLPATVPLVRPHPAGTGTQTVDVAVDVVEAGENRVEALDDRVRPVPGGYRISVRADDKSVSWGTFGVYTPFGGRLRGITDNHVVSSNGRYTSQEVVQPREGRDNHIGQVAGYTPVTTYLDPWQSRPVYNRYDCAWIDLYHDEIATRQIALTKRIPTGFTDPVKDQRVTVVGAATGAVKVAKVAETLGKKAMLWDEYEDTGGQTVKLYAWFEYVTILDHKITQKGDCGAPYVNDQGGMVALHLGSNDQHSFGLRAPAPPPPERAG